MRGLDIVCYGEILWDNLKDSRRLGGAPLNVCYHLGKLGLKSSIISRVGKDQEGFDILGEMKKLGVEDEFCSILPSKRTSSVNVIIDSNLRISYEIVEDVAWDYIECSEKECELVRNASALVFGSLAARSEISRQTLYSLIKLSDFRVFDVNLRWPFYSRELIFSLLKETELLKLNEEEMWIISEWLGIKDNAEVDQIQFLMKRFSNIKEIILTRGSLGASYFSNKEIHNIKAYPVKIKNTVGSGDSFLAAFLASKIKGDSIKSALHQASILSSFIAGQDGACPEYDLAELSLFGEE